MPDLERVRKLRDEAEDQGVLCRDDAIWLCGIAEAAAGVLDEASGELQLPNRRGLKMAIDELRETFEKGADLD